MADALFCEVKIFQGDQKAEVLANREKTIGKDEKAQSEQPLQGKENAKIGKT